jgi:hypothetical protein
VSHAQDETPVDNIEVLDFEQATEVAGKLGLNCTVAIARPLLAEIGARALLERLRDVLKTTGEDPAFELFRAVALRGEHATGARESRELHESITAFAARVRAGVGGISDTGTMLALSVASPRGATTVVYQLGFGLLRPANPAITITSADGASYFIERIASRRKV